MPERCFRVQVKPAGSCPLAHSKVTAVFQALEKPGNQGGTANCQQQAFRPWIYRDERLFLLSEGSFVDEVL
jgi:hypothetical protein